MRQGAVTLAYNDFDQLLEVRGVPAANGTSGTVQYAYGHDGLRVLSIGTDGAETFRLSPSLTERADGTREIDVSVGDRLLARVTRSPQAGAAITAGAVDGGSLHSGLVIAALLLMVEAFARLRTYGAPRSRRRLALAVLAARPVDIFDDPWKYRVEARRVRDEEDARYWERENRIDDAARKALHDPDSPFALPQPQPQQACRPQNTLSDVAGGSI